MSDSFFDRLTQKIDAVRADQTSEKEKLEAARAYSHRQIATAADVAKKYAEQLTNKNIKVILIPQDDSISFDMYWPDGQDHGLWLVTDPDTGKLRFKFNSMEDGQRTSGTGLDLYGPERWQSEIFTETLEREIERFVELAKDHGGLA